MPGAFPSPLARFITASGFSNLADGIATVAWAWLASLLTRDPLLIASVPMVLRLPWFLFAIPAGLVTDRVDRRRLILAMDATRACGFLIAAMVVYASLPLPEPPPRGLAAPWSFAGIAVAALLVGSAEVFRDNAAQTMMPRIVAPSGLERANGRLWSVELLGNDLLGPALGAFLIGLSLGLPFLFNAMLYLIAILAVFSLKGQFAPAERASAHWRAELREAVVFLWHAPLLRRLALITGGWNLFDHMTMVALLLIVQENFGLGAQAYGLILAGGALGGVAGGLVSDRIVAWMGPGQAARLMLAGSFPCFGAMALAPGPVALAAAIAVLLLTGVIWNTVSVSYRQREIPDAILGRVNALYRMLAWGMIPLGIGLSGVVIRLAETYLPRADALLVPVWIAAFGSLGLAIRNWHALGAGFPTGKRGEQVTEGPV